MANLDRNTIKSLIELSRIDCSEEEQEKLLKDLKSILDYVDLMNEVDTSHVTPCNHVLEEIANVMREDLVGPPLPRELFLSNTPSHVGGMVRVPPVLKQTS